MEYSGMMLDELRKTNKLLERVANTLVDIENLLEHNPQRSPTLRAPVQPEQKCPSCDGRGYWTDGYNNALKCGACNGTGHF
jgi:DnaJ-class molecular chaperone